MSIYTYQEKLWLYEQMKSTDKDDQFYLFRLLRKNSEDYTENTNGIFFDLNRLRDETLQEMMSYYKVVKPMIEPKPYYEEE